MAKYATDVWPNNAFQELPSCGLYSCATENGVCPCTGTVLYGSSSGNNNPASSETKAKCLTTAAAIHGSTALSRGKLTSGHWAHVPSGCSVQSRGDGAAHWNSYAGIGVKADYISVGKTMQWYGANACSLKKAAQVFECSGYAKVYVSKIQRDNACKSSNYWVDRLLKATKATRTFINTAAATNFHASVIYRTSSNLFCGSTR